MPERSDIPDALDTRIAQRLARDLGPRRYELWIRPSVRLSYRGDDRTLRVHVPNRFVADKVRSDFADALRRAAAAEADLTGDDEPTLDVRIEPAKFDTPPAADADAPPAAPVKPHRHPADPTPPDRPVRYRHRFEDFVVGPSNELAYAAALALADHDPDDPEHADAPAPGPLVIYGDCGLGKTHLLQAVCQRVQQRRPHAKILYTTAESFTNDFIAAVKGNKLDAFRKRVRRLDLLAVDDIAFFAGKEKTQQEFLHCFDHVELAGARLVLASDCHPSQIRSFREALVSRCVHGLVVRVHAPDAPTRLALVHRLAKRRGLVLSPGLDGRLAAHAGRSVRDLEGMVTHLHALAALAQPKGPTRLVNRVLVERLFDGQRRLQPDRPVPFDTIRDNVCDALSVPTASVAGSSRRRQVVLARAVVVHLAYQMAGLSYPEIAAALGKSSHSTVVTAGKRFAKQIEDDAPLMVAGYPEPVTPSRLVEDLRRRVLQGPRKT
ncbi:MAG: DnaA/Hda family protein [Planctomycetota bacterium]